MTEKLDIERRRKNFISSCKSYKKSEDNIAQLKRKYGLAISDEMFLSDEANGIEYRDKVRFRIWNDEISMVNKVISGLEKENSVLGKHIIIAIYDVYIDRISSVEKAAEEIGISRASFWNKLYEEIDPYL